MLSGQDIAIVSPTSRRVASVPRVGAALAVRADDALPPGENTERAGRM